MNFESVTWKISDLLKVYEEDRLDLSPPYQRNEVWTAKAQQKLLESILTGKPIPSFFLLRKQRRASVEEVEIALQPIMKEMANI